MLCCDGVATALSSSGDVQCVVCHIATVLFPPVLCCEGGETEGGRGRGDGTRKGRGRGERLSTKVKEWKEKKRETGRKEGEGERRRDGDTEYRKGREVKE